MRDRTKHCGECDRRQKIVAYVNGCLCACHGTKPVRRRSWQERADELGRIIRRGAL